MFFLNINILLKKINKFRKNYGLKPFNSIYDINKSENFSFLPTSSGFSSVLMGFNATLYIPAGIGISIINKQNEELIYFLFYDVKMHILKQDINYQLTIHVNKIQV